MHRSLVGKAILEAPRKSRITVAALALSIVMPLLRLPWMLYCSETANPQKMLGAISSTHEVQSADWVDRPIRTELIAHPA